MRDMVLQKKAQSAGLQGSRGRRRDALSDPLSDPLSGGIIGGGAPGAAAAIQGASSGLGAFGWSGFGGASQSADGAGAPVQGDTGALGQESSRPPSAFGLAPIAFSLDRGAPIQAEGGMDTGSVHEAAASGISGSGGPLPHQAAIQSSFGRHDISGVKAHTGGAADAANKAMGSNAYATGNDVAFKSGSADLHTAAHEAAHVVQQRGGVQLKGGVGQAGDQYERHADAVADRVVQGKSAESLLDQYSGGGGGGGVQGDGLQMKEGEKTPTKKTKSDEPPPVDDATAKNIELNKQKEKALQQLSSTAKTVSTSIPPTSQVKSVALNTSKAAKAIVPESGEKKSVLERIDGWKSNLDEWAGNLDQIKETINQIAVLSTGDAAEAAKKWQGGKVSEFIGKDPVLPIYAAISGLVEFGKNCKATWDVFTGQEPGDRFESVGQLASDIAGEVDAVGKSITACANLSGATNLAKYMSGPFAGVAGAVVGSIQVVMGTYKVITSLWSMSGISELQEEESKKHRMRAVDNLVAMDDQSQKQGPTAREDALAHLKSLLKAKAGAAAFSILQGSMAIVAGVLTATGVGAPVAAAFALAGALLSLGKWLYGKWGEYKAKKSEARRLVAAQILSGDATKMVKGKKVKCSEEEAFDARGLKSGGRTDMAKSITGDYTDQAKKDYKAAYNEAIKELNTSLAGQDKATRKATFNKEKAALDASKKEFESTADSVKSSADWGHLSHDEKVEAAGRYDPFFGGMSVSDQEKAAAVESIETKKKARKTATAGELVKDIDGGGGRMAKAISFDYEKLAKGNYKKAWADLGPTEKLALAEKMVASLGG